MQDKWFKLLVPSYSRLRRDELIAARLLKLWSLLGCSDVSPELILMGRKAQLEKLNRVVDEVAVEADKYSMNSLLAFLSQATKSAIYDRMDVLRRYALLPASEEKGFTRIHPTIRALCLQTADSPAIDRHLLSIAVTLVATMVKGSGHVQTLHGLDVGLPTYTQAIGACIGTLPLDEGLAIDCLTIAEYLEQWEHSSEVENLYLYAREAFTTRADSNFKHATYKLAVLYHNQGRIHKAERKLRSLLELGHDSDCDTYTLRSCELLGSILTERGNSSKAEEFLERARVGFEKTEGPWSPMTLRAIRNLGHLTLRQGQLDLAERMFLLAQERSKKAGTVEAPLLSCQLLAAPGLVDCYVRSGRFELAESAALSACETAERFTGPNHASTLASYYTLAMVNIHQGKLELAKSRYDKAQEGRSAILSRDHVDMYARFVQLGPVSIQQQEPARALQHLAYKAFCELFPKDGAGPLVGRTSLAHFLHRQGRLQEAEILCRKALRMQIRYLDNCHELVPITTFCLGMILQDQGKTDQAISTLIDAIQDFERFAVSQRDLLLRAYRALDSAYRSKNMSREADEVAHELRQLYEDASPRSSAKQDSINEWLKKLRLSIPKQVYEAEYECFVQAANVGVKDQPEQVRDGGPEEQF
jgi:tetratricopeptide (TPR) repeat protein